MDQLLLSCIESRVENNRSFYGRFQLGPFDKGQGLTVANAFRRVLLAELIGLAFTSVEIDGATHEYATLKGVKESVLDLILNLKQVVLTSEFQLEEPQVAYLQFQGPGIVRASDIKLPLSIHCVDPEQYIATVSSDGFLNAKFTICEGKNTTPDFRGLYRNHSQKIFKTGDVSTLDTSLSGTGALVSSNTLDSNTLFSSHNSNQLPIDPVFMPVNKVNFLLEVDSTYSMGIYSNQAQRNPLKELILLEIWTNGSIHPRQAIHDAAKILMNLFSPFQESRSFKSIFLNSRKTIQTKKGNEKKIISLDIGNLDLSLRPYTCLKRANIHTVGDLLQYSPDELLLLKNFGKRSLEEVEKNLHQLGLRLRNQTEIKNLTRRDEKK